MVLVHLDDHRLTATVCNKSALDMFGSISFDYVVVTVEFRSKFMASWRFGDRDSAEKFAESVLKEPITWLLLKYPVETA